MVIEAGNKVLNERGNGSVIVTTTEGDRPRIATTKQPHNAVGYEVVIVNGKGHEHESVEDLEKENATTSRFEKMENSARVLQSNPGAWKTTVALTPTVDQAAFDPLVTVAGGCRPITDAINKASKEHNTSMVKNIACPDGDCQEAKLETNAALQATGDRAITHVEPLEKMAITCVVQNSGATAHISNANDVMAEGDQPNFGHGQEGVMAKVVVAKEGESQGAGVDKNTAALVDFAEKRAALVANAVQAGQILPKGKTACDFDGKAATTQLNSPTEASKDTSAATVPLHTTTEFAHSEGQGNIRITESVFEQAKEQVQVAFKATAANKEVQLKKTNIDTEDRKLQQADKKLTPKKE